MKSKKIVSLILAVTMIMASVISVHAKYYSNLTVSWNGYSLVGLNVVKETLHASGYSYSSSGKVTDVWLTTDRCYITNEVTDEMTWTATHPVGEYARGSFKVKIGIPSPWGTIGTSGTTHTLSILF